MEAAGKRVNGGKSLFGPFVQKILPRPLPESLIEDCVFRWFCLLSEMTVRKMPGAARVAALCVLAGLAAGTVRGQGEVKGADNVVFGDGLSLALPPGWKVTTLQTAASPRKSGSSGFEPRAATLLLFARPVDASRDGSIALIRDASFGGRAGPLAMQDAVVRLSENAAEAGFLTESFATRGAAEGADNILSCEIRGVAVDGSRRRFGCVVMNRFPKPTLRCFWQWREPDSLAEAEFAELVSSMSLEGALIADALNASPMTTVMAPKPGLSSPSEPVPPSESASPGTHPAEDPSVPSAGSTAPEPSPTPSGAPSAEVAGIISSSRDSLVVIEGENGTGSGFVCGLDGQPWLLTNAHVLAGNPRPRFTKLNGAELPLGPASLGVGHDICRISAPGGTAMLEAMTDTDQVARIGDAVAVLGNAEGAGVIKPFEGRIVGLGPNLVEVDAPFVPGNSGSPIIHVPTGKVLGIATYLVTRKIDPKGDGSVQTSVRRFGYRLDSVKAWEPVDWARFYAQAAQVERIQATGEDFARLFADAREKSISSANYTNSQIKRALETFERVAKSGRRMSAADLGNARRALLGDLRIAAMTDINAFDARTAYDYFRREVADEKKFRDDVYTGFTRAMESVSP